MLRRSCIDRCTEDSHHSQFHDTASATSPNRSCQLENDRGPTDRRSTPTAGCGHSYCQWSLAVSQGSHRLPHGHQWILIGCHSIYLPVWHIFDLDLWLWTTTLTFNPRPARVMVPTCIRNRRQRPCNPKYWVKTADKRTDRGPEPVAVPSPLLQSIIKEPLRHTNIAALGSHALVIPKVK